MLHEGSIDKRVQYMIEGLFAVRKTSFAEFPGVDEALDLVDRSLPPSLSPPPLPPSLPHSRKPSTLNPKPHTLHPGP